MDKSQGDHDLQEFSCKAEIASWEGKRRLLLQGFGCFGGVMVWVSSPKFTCWNCIKVLQCSLQQSWEMGPLRGDWALMNGFHYFRSGLVIMGVHSWQKHEFSHLPFSLLFLLPCIHVQEGHLLHGWLSRRPLADTAPGTWISQAPDKLNKFPFVANHVVSGILL
jgi:hypothetical protein